MRDLYKFICTHSLAVVCGETSDRNPNEPKLQAVKITDGKRSDTMSAALTESEIRKVVDFLADCTIIGYGAPLNFFRKLCSQYNIQYSYPTIDIAEFAQEILRCGGKGSLDFTSQLRQRCLPMPETASDYCHTVVSLLFSYAKEQAFYRYLRVIKDLQL